MSNVSLTSAMNSNLLALKQTSALMAMTQNRLATGLKVNSAIDNPSAYYTAVSLNNRAADLNSLLDNMGQAIQTVKAAVEGVNTATAFLEQMQSITEQAIAEPIELETPSNTSSILHTRPLDKFEGYTQITADMSVADIQALITDGAKLVLAEDITLADQLNINVNNVTIDGNGHKLTYTNTNYDSMLNISGSNAEINNINFNIDVSLDGNAAITIASPAKNVKITNFELTTSKNYVIGIKITGNDSAVKMNNFKITASGNNFGGIYGGANDTEITNFEINATGNGSTGISTDYNSGIMIKLDSDAGINVSGTDSQKLQEIGSGKITIDSSLIWDDSESEFPTDDENSKGPENIGVAAEWSKAFNDVLKQYDMLVDDASYKGVNLLKGEQLNVAFNEDKSSRLNILGKDIHSSSLGLSAAEWKTVADVNVAVADLQRCVSTLRSLSSELGNNYSVVQSRQDFTENLINILTEGADKLTLADMNEESAIMLALQTRQQLAINSLSLASQSAQSVLRLFA